MKRREQIARFFARPAADAEERRSAAAQLWAQRGETSVARLYHGYSWSLPLRLFANPLASLPRLLNARDRYRHPDQRPAFYLPFLESAAWWPRDAWIDALEVQHPVILEEFYRVESETRKHPQKFLVGAGDWSIFDLYRHGKRIQKNCELCPRTVEIAETLPLCTDAGGMLYFSIMAPGTHLKPHCGFSNTRIRYHLGLEVGAGARFRVGDETREWETGKAFAFDDSFEHEVIHDGDARRVILLADCWHPALRPEERILIRDLMRALDLPQR